MISRCLWDREGRVTHLNHVRFSAKDERLRLLGAKSVKKAYISIIQHYVSTDIKTLLLPIVYTCARLDCRTSHFSHLYQF